MWQKLERDFPPLSHKEKLEIYNRIKLISFFLLIPAMGK
jgi:hypothetical protein